MKKDKITKIIYILAILFFLFSVIGIAIYGVSNGIFTSEESLILFVEKTGAFAPITFLVLEVISVVILVIPCSMGYGVGTALFGPFWSTVLNCIASFLGSLIIFLMVRKWGNKILTTFVSEKNLNKYYKLLENEKRFESFFKIMLLLPFTPDNVLCFIAGNTKISLRRYCWIIAMFKLWKILIFCYGVDFFLEILGNLL